MKTLSLREIQLEELEILKTSAAFFDKHHIKYTLAGGTLLGAIRHGGFIPWDDDIDIIIPRPDYLRLIEILKNEKIGEYNFQCFESGTLDYPFAKITNPKIKIKSKSAIDNNLWIDIFPADGIPSDKREQEQLFHHINLQKGRIYLKTTSFSVIWHEKKSLANRILKVLLKPLAHLHSVKYYSKKIQEYVLKTPYETSEYAAEAVWGYGVQEIMPKTVFEQYKKITFEKQKFSAVKEYNYMLAKIYGDDYMQLPPKEKQICHHITAIKD